jgi:hypothetical protein
MGQCSHKYLADARDFSLKTRWFLQDVAQVLRGLLRAQSAGNNTRGAETLVATTECRNTSFELIRDLRPGHPPLRGFPGSALKPFRARRRKEATPGCSPTRSLAKGRGSMVKGRGVGMIRTIGGILVLFLLAGLFRAYRDGRFAVAQPATQGAATFGEGLTDPPNWKVESASSAMVGRQLTQPDGRPGSPVASVARYGIVVSSPPPFWGRRNVKPSGTAQANIPRVPSVEPPRATSLPNSGQQAKGGQPPVIKVAGGGTLVAVHARSGPAPVAVVDEEHRALLRHAQFLIKAGLAPVAKEPLQQILREVPGTPIAREARLTLDSIRN